MPRWVREPQRGCGDGPTDSLKRQRSSGSAGGIKPSSGDDPRALTGIRCGNAQTNNRAGTHEVNIRCHMQESLVHWHMQTRRTQKCMHTMKAAVNVKQKCTGRVLEFYSCWVYLYEYSNKTTRLLYFDIGICSQLFFICTGWGERVHGVPWPKIHSSSECVIKACPTSC